MKYEKSLKCEKCKFFVEPEGGYGIKLKIGACVKNPPVIIEKLLPDYCGSDDMEVEDTGFDEIHVATRYPVVDHLNPACDFFERVCE